MLIAAIPVIQYELTRQQLQRALGKVDGVELRFDYAESIDITEVRALREEFTLPMIFTLRKKSQGGFYPGNEETRLQALLALCDCQPEYLDLEYDVPLPFWQQIKMLYPAIRLISSYHHFTETPNDLMAVFAQMQHPYCDAYKLATFANTTLDALRMLQFVSSQRNHYRLTGICMGADGQCTRILSPVVGNAMNYVCLTPAETTASGQLTVDELESIYHYRKLNTETKIYALLGDPIFSSVGHIVHNQAIEYLQENAVYLKLRVTKAELAQFFMRCQSLPFFGFSVTMPLKEAVMSYLEDIDETARAIKAVNTIVRSGQHYLGLNTDGVGAIAAVSENIALANQRVIILGAGGAARAIAYVALQHQAKVIILNRTVHKARELAGELECGWDELSALSTLDYAVVINTLPETVLVEKNIQSGSVVMDIVYQPIYTAFLLKAKEANCICVPGFKMYVNQAVLQIERWFAMDEKQRDGVRALLNDYFEVFIQIPLVPPLKKGEQGAMALA